MIFSRSGGSWGGFFVCRRKKKKGVAPGKAASLLGTISLWDFVPGRGPGFPSGPLGPSSIPNALSTKIGRLSKLDTQYVVPRWGQLLISFLRHQGNKKWPLKLFFISLMAFLLVVGICRNRRQIREPPIGRHYVH